MLPVNFNSLRENVSPMYNGQNKDKNQMVTVESCPFPFFKRRILYNVTANFKLNCG